MPKKKRKNCSGTKGYNCGQTCISRFYVCHKELSGQSIKIASRLSTVIKEIKSNKPVISNGLFPSSADLAKIDIPDLPINKPKPKQQLKPKAKAPIKKELDLSKIKPLDKNKSDAQQATELFNQIKEAGYTEKGFVKGDIIRFPPNNGILEINNGVVSYSTNTDKKLREIVDKVNEKPKSTNWKENNTNKAHSQLFKKLYMEPEEKVSALKSINVKNPVDTLEAIEDYTGGSSTVIRKTEAGVPNYDDAAIKTKVDLINDFIDKAPKVEAELYSGFKYDMKDVYALDKLKEGDEFNFPSMTSFSTDKAIANGFDGAGFIKLINNKSGASVKNVSFFSEESEVLVPKKASYKIVKIEDGIHGRKDYTLEEQ